MNGHAADFFFEDPNIGKGQLTVNIVYNGITIPAQISQTESNKFRISYKPIGSGTYTIRVYYVDQEVQGSPFTMEVIDAKDVKTSGEGLTSGEVGQRSSFNMNLGQMAFISDVKVVITSPRGMPIQPSIFEKGGGNVIVEFSPTEAGEHLIDVRYFDKPVAGSPFSCQVTDSNQILLFGMPSTGSINRPVEFDIDASRAGQGKLEISVNDGIVPCFVDKQGNQRFRASFTPSEVMPHVVRLRFNDREIHGSPWLVEVRNPASTAVVSSNVPQAIPVNVSAELEIRLNSNDSEVAANVTAPNAQTYPSTVSNMRSGLYRVEFVPREAGTHLVQVLVDGVVVPGSPYTFKAYNPNAIIVTPPGIGTMGVPVEFTIDASKAGEGQLEIMVNKGSVSNITKVLSKGIFMVSFIPNDPRPHIVDVLFNKEPVPNTPLSVPIQDARGLMVMSQGNSLQEVASNRHSIFKLHQNQITKSQQFQQQQQQFQQPLQAYVEEEMNLRVTAPNGEPVPAKILPQQDGDYKLDYMSKYTGRHRVEITCGGQAVMGSPFYVEIYDPNKIKVEGNKKGMVGEQMYFDIIRNQAGKAELKVSIKGPRGNAVRYEMYNTTQGEKVWYTPQEPGVYSINILFGGLNVPGCPIKQEIFDSSLILAEGDGLIKGLEDNPAVFYVDPRGQKGELKVQVDGPNSIAKCVISQEYDGRYMVSYLPAEPGHFLVAVKWNGREIEGSPFRPRITALQKVSPIGGWETLLDANNNLMLRLNETRMIEFDTRGCGQGNLTASLTGPSGSLPVDIRMRDKEIYALSFTPQEEGEYRLKVFWNGNQIERSPLAGFARREVATRSASTNAGLSEVDGHYFKQQKMLSTTTTAASQQVNSTQNQSGIYNIVKVVLTGIGLQNAFVNQQAEFHVDGTNAGPGVPHVRLEGPTGEVPVQCLDINPCIYKCTYYPPVPGIYTLYIRWADHDVIGSPFKINVQPATPGVTNSLYQMPKNSTQYLIPSNPQLVVTPPSETVVRSYSSRSATQTRAMSPSASSMAAGTVGRAKQVVCNGEGLSGAKVGRELRTSVDVSRAGPGVLAAQCHGQTKTAPCRLVDKGSGLYHLFIEPQEGGQHSLQIKYNKEHIVGSPMNFKVAYPPDASKIKCSGPGIKSGALRSFRGIFYVDTDKAGPGELGVNVRGPRGGFNSELSREKHNDRRIICSYHPTEPGDYVIHVTWSGDEVPGSPFRLRIAASEAEFNSNHQQLRTPTPHIAQERYHNNR